MAPTHVQILEVFALHEPPLSRPSATLSPPCGERAGRGVPIWFMVPMHAEKRKGASHELPLRPPRRPRFVLLVSRTRTRTTGFLVPMRVQNWRTKPTMNEQEVLL